ncbi:MAG: Ger(x)C family spore germination protein [Ignavibacteriales bacterium]
MVTKFIKSLTIIFFIFLTTGCWDYVGLEDITIVTGIAIDMDEKKDEYKLSFEVINSASSSRQQNEIRTAILESAGSTIFDAVRNGKKKVMNKLYFSNVQVVIISNQIAREKGINSVIDFFLREEEIRETLSFVISKEKTARELLEKNGIDNPITAFEMKKIIKKDNSVVSNTEDSELYKVFNSLNCKGMSLVLPLFHNIENDKKQVIESDGIAVFNKDKLFDYLTSNESKSYLFIEGNVKGGIITLDMNNDKKDDVSIEIATSSTMKNFSNNNDKYKFNVKVKMEGILGEQNGNYKEVDSKKVDKMEKMAEKKITKDIKKLIEKAQKELKVDIFSFGNLVYKNDPKVWKKIKKDWGNIFLEVEVDVDVKVHILNTAFMK